tara:strand:- start:883 stop:1131 length:249 start_codon:yes stop_codon:yes gene_type:complete
MSNDYKNIFEILDAIKDSELALDEARVLKRELLFAGEPTNEELRFLYKNFVQLIDYNIEFNIKNIKKLKLMHEEWRDDTELF